MTVLSSLPYLLIIYLSLEISLDVKAEDLEDSSHPPIFQINGPRSLVRENREATPSTSGYEADIEISFPDFSMATIITKFLENNLGTLIVNNVTTITTVNADPACNLTGSIAICSCPKEYECLWTKGPCTETECTCITTLPLQKYCTFRPYIAVSPMKLFTGDTATLTCSFSEVMDLSWYHNSRGISDNAKYDTSFTKQGALVVYQLRIKDLQDSDTGNYICSGTTNGTLQNLTIVVNISGVEITTSSTMETFCDGSTLSIYCCSANIDDFNVTWDPEDAPGVESRNVTCSIYTLTADRTRCAASQPKTSKTYTCHFQKNQGVNASRTITVNYFSEVKIDIKTVTPTTAGKTQTITCNTDVSVSNLQLSINTAGNVKNSTSNGSLVIFTISTTTPDWSGMFICTAYQSSLSTSKNITVDLVPLPRKTAIHVYPLQSYMNCGTPVVLTCCVMDQNYHVSFKNSTTVTPGTPAASLENMACFTYTQSIECKPNAESTVHCLVTNRLSDNVTSQDAMIIGRLDGKTCKADVIRLETPTGKNYSVPCLSLDQSLLGNLIYPCNDEIWGEEINDCYSAEIFWALETLKDLINGPDVAEQMALFLENVTRIAKKERGYIGRLSKNIELMVNIISMIASANITISPAMMENILQIVDTMVSNKTSWETLSDQSVTLLKSMEILAKNLKFNSSISIKNETSSNVQLFGEVVNRDSTYEANFSMAGLNSTIMIRNGSLPDDVDTVVTIAYSTMKDLLPHNTTDKINALVISTVISNPTSRDINRDVFNITMTFTKSNQSLKNPDCAWLDLENHYWYNSGCQVLEASDEEVKCSCNHLTSFSNLMGDGSPQFLNIISYVGIVASIVCLVITLVIEAVVWRSVIKNKTSYMRHVCLVNIAVNLLIADIWFIIGAALAPDTSEHPNVNACIVAAFFAFYFYLALFFWMLVLGLILFYRLIYLLHDISRRIMMIIAFILGYGCPLLIAVITVAVTAPSGTFIGTKFCWLSYDGAKTFLAFVIPVLTIVFLNFIVLIVVIFKLLRPSIGERPRHEERQNVLVIAKSMAVLMPLLGTSWGFGLAVSLKPEIEGFHVVFVILNSFQGLFILISTVLLDQNIRKAVKNSISTSYWSTLRTKIQSSSTNSASSSTPRRKNMFARKAWVRLKN
ncbi:adhesion G protein-coupled receptor F5-like [Leptodactylus fuscus]|uniref:adhesion G protein-coupled receptor F5-like n=1 Tax=Leptodactylus fuscus TaxID=238119 RepID=UPI003F4F10B6